MTARPLNATAASLLGFLHDGPMTGWDLVVTAQDRIGDFWSLTQSQVYRELAAMAATGLVRAGERGRRDRQPYAITDAGRAAFAEWVAREPGAETIRFPLLLGVLFGRHLPPGRLAEHLHRHRAVHAARLADYERQRAELPPGAADAEPYAVATLDFGLAYERAVLTWFDALPAALTGGAGGGPAPAGGGPTPARDAGDGPAPPDGAGGAPISRTRR
jgi:DNA-binding PadR family transcriptional regulator